MAGTSTVRPELIRAGIPDLAERDAFVCGPPGLERELERSLKAAGTKTHRLHIESFESDHGRIDQGDCARHGTVRGCVGVVAGFDRAIHPAPVPTGTADTAASPTCDTATTITGDSVQTRWGPVQVQASVLADGSICRAEAVVYPDSDGEAMQINSYAPRSSTKR